MARPKQLSDPYPMRFTQSFITRVEELYRMTREHPIYSDQFSTKQRLIRHCSNLGLQVLERQLKEPEDGLQLSMFAVEEEEKKT